LTDNCKYCGKPGRMWIPGGIICDSCGKNINTIIKQKLGIPKPGKNGWSK